MEAATTAAAPGDAFVLQRMLADAEEFAELPVRHNEEELNEQLGRIVQWPRAGGDYESAHCKTFLLLQTHLERLPLPIADYKNDCRTALSQVSRVRLSPRLASYPLPHIHILQLHLIFSSP